MTQPTQKDLDRAKEYAKSQVELDQEFYPQEVECIAKHMAMYVLHLEQLGVIKFCENRYNEQLQVLSKYKFICGQCNDQFETMDELDSHKIHHHKP